MSEKISFNQLIKMVNDRGLKHEFIVLDSSVMMIVADPAHDLYYQVNIDHNNTYIQEFALTGRK